MAVEPNLRDAADYAAATGFALDLLGRLKEGTVTLAGSAFYLRISVGSNKTDLFNNLV